MNGHRGRLTHGVSDGSGVPPSRDGRRYTGNMQSRVVVTGDPLTIEQVVAVARGQASAVMGPEVAERMAPARRIVEDAVASDAIVYGVTTGFGALASTRVERDEAAELQVNLLRSHAAGVGDPLSDDVVRAMLLLRARTLSQ